MSILLWIILMTSVVGLISLVGVVSFWVKEKVLRKMLMALVAFSAGALLSGALFHLLVESLEELSPMKAFSFLLVGFVMFFLVERFLHWHHCHNGRCETHRFTYLILFGDGIHNLIDGLIIAASFFVSVPFGIVTSLIIIGHEIPQELGDFGALVYGGFSKFKALAYNFVSQIICVIGGVVGYFLAGSVEGVIPFILPFAAGGFIYISASDLIPELHKEPDIKKSLNSFAFFIVGILFMFITKIILGG